MPDLPPSVRATAALRDVAASIEDAWARHRADHPDAGEAELAADVWAAPNQHEWRVVEAALERLRCEECGAALGSGPKGCGSCDLADGFRFSAREPDRPGVPPGNEHAIRVASAVLRSPHRYPEWSVRGNELFLPLFLAGDMPTRAEQVAILEASKRRPLDTARLERAASFAELARLAADDAADHR